MRKYRLLSIFYVVFPHWDSYSVACRLYILYFRFIHSYVWIILHLFRACFCRSRDNYWWFRRSPSGHLTVQLWPQFYLLFALPFLCMFTLEQEVLLVGLCKSLPVLVLSLWLALGHTLYHTGHYRRRRHSCCNEQREGLSTLEVPNFWRVVHTTYRSIL